MSVRCVNPSRWPSAIVWRRRAERKGSSHEPDEAASYGRHALAALSLVAFFWLTTLDVHVDERNADGVPAFCGSAYDVALLKGDGFMGGEVPPDQAAIDTACLAAARTDVVLSGTAGVTDLAAAAYAVLLQRRTRVPGQGSRRPSCAPSDGLRRVAATFYD
jgi:hypothetical protein